MSPLLQYLNLFLKAVAQVYFDPFGIVMGLDAVKSFSGNFSVADILRRFPGVGIDMISRVLKDLQAQGLSNALAVAEVQNGTKPGIR